MKRILVAFALLVCAAPARAGTITVKLSSMAPAGSTWAKALAELAVKWKDVSNGSVKLEIVPPAGSDESGIVTALEKNGLQAAALSTDGLSEITPEPLGLDFPSVPADVHAALLAKLRSKMELALEKKGFVAIAWVQLGPVRLFSTRSLDDQTILHTDVLVPVIKSPLDAWIGLFHSKQLKIADFSGFIGGAGDTTALMPVDYALAIKANDKLTYVDADDFTQLTAALIIDKKTWESIPADLHRKIGCASCWV